MTAIQLLPVQSFVSERRLVERGLTNYWDRRALACFAPHHDYASAPMVRQDAEFETMGATLHAAGIEVMLDVVVNPSAEGGGDGPTLSLRGLDRLAGFFDVIPQHPVVSRVKLVAEPWDLGLDGYQVSNFPPLWAEWNGRYRAVSILVGD